MSGSVLYLGDCRTILAGLDASSIDAVVCDPPYELGFMGKAWDATGIAYDVEVWRQCLRVLKPGGHLLAFGGSRTYHRLACAVEDAGFEVRDQIMWLYGSGFPKSLDVSKAIDREGDAAHKGARRETILTVTTWIAEARDAAELSNADIDEHFGLNGMAGHWTSAQSQPAVPRAELWPRLLELLRSPEPPEHVRAAVDEWLRLKGQPAPTWDARPITGQHDGAAPGHLWRGGLGFDFDPNPKQRRDVGALEAARQWAGWGTALKPAHEPIVVARKPLAGTVAATVLAHGTGALNVAACRVGDEVRSSAPTSLAACHGNRLGDPTRTERRERMDARDYIGRWPANVLHDGSDEVIEAFPADELGSSARFFYAAKASAEDRDEGLQAFAARPVGTYAQDEWSRANMGGTPDAARAPRRNIHPTVKPTDLMRYLVRLVTPPGGTVLDPFTGSGSTGKAATLEGFGFIGCELNPEYLAIAQARIDHAARQPKQQALELPGASSGWLERPTPSNLDLFAAD